MANTSQHSSCSCGWFAGLIIGGVIGAAVALLYAPKSGKETREELLAQLDDVKTRIDEATREFRESAMAKIAETRNDIGKAVDAGRTAAKARAEDLRKKAGLD